jgi:hypothetical protein
MPDNDPNAFTDREKLLLSYYRATEADVSRRTWLWDASLAAGSLVCLLLSVARDDNALAFVAYALAAGRWFFIVIEGGRWQKEFRSILAKYEAKTRELTETRRRDAGAA